MKETNYNNRSTERKIGNIKRVLAGDNVRHYDYKTILVPGDLHHELKKQAYSEGMSIRRLVEKMFNEQYPHNRDLTKDNE